MPKPNISGTAHNIHSLNGSPYPTDDGSRDAPFRVLRPDNSERVVYCGSPHAVLHSISSRENPPTRRSSPRRHVVEQRLSDGTWAPCGAIEHHSDCTARYVPDPLPVAAEEPAPS